MGDDRWREGIGHNRMEWRLTLLVKNQTYAINIVFSRPTLLHVEKTVNGKGGIIVGIM